MKEYLKNITESDRVTDVLKKYGLKIEIPFKKALNNTEMFLNLGLKYKALTITIHCAPQ